MKYFFSIIFLFFLLLSCSRYSETQIGKSSATIYPKGVGGELVREKPWRVGALRRQKVSKGFTYNVLLPYLERDDIQTIVRKFKVDSWILRLRKKGLMKNELIGHISLPLFAPGFNQRPLVKKEQRVSQMKKAILQIHYRSAAISSRLAELRCPSLGHNLRIEELKLSETEIPKLPITISSFQRKTVLARVDKYDYHYVFDAGASIVGEYIAEIALYDSKKRITYTDWIPLPKSAVVSAERNIRIKGCENFKIPDPGSGPSPMDQFEFGRRKKRR